MTAVGRLWNRPFLVLGAVASVAVLSSCGEGSPVGGVPTVSPTPSLHSARDDNRNGLGSQHRKRRLSGATITVNPSQPGPTVTTGVLGGDMGVWYPMNKPWIVPAFEAVHLVKTRFPGGKAADIYHWETNRDSVGTCSHGQQPNANSNFDRFMANVAMPAHLDTAVQVNYGSNGDCSGPADPTEAASWVTYANNTEGYGISYWTVGNEQYASGAVDLHSPAHDPTEYSSVESSQYYNQMHVASRVPINVCVDGDLHSNHNHWNTIVFSQALYDCVELHYYAQNGTLPVSDSYIVNQAALDFTTELGAIRSDLNAVGRGSTPLYVAEIGSVTGPGGKQTQSITQALFAGQMIGEMLNDGITRATWHIGFGGCDPKSKGGDFSSQLYGWQNFGGAMIFSDENPACGDIAGGTILATAAALETASDFVRNGETMLGTTVQGSTVIRAYASSYAGGYALMLFNLDENASHDVTVSINGKAAGSGGTVYTYDKLLYDASKNKVWKTPTSAPLAPWVTNFILTLPAWSIEVVQTQ